MGSCKAFYYLPFQDSDSITREQFFNQHQKLSTCCIDSKKLTEEVINNRLNALKHYQEQQVSILGNVCIYILNFCLSYWWLGLLIWFSEFFWAKFLFYSNFIGLPQLEGNCFIRNKVLYRIYSRKTLTGNASECCLNSTLSFLHKF